MCSRLQKKEKKNYIVEIIAITFIARLNVNQL